MRLLIDSFTDFQQDFQLLSIILFAFLSEPAVLVNFRPIERRVLDDTITFERRLPRSIMLLTILVEMT